MLLIRNNLNIHHSPIAHQQSIISTSSGMRKYKANKKDITSSMSWHSNKIKQLENNNDIDEWEDESVLDSDDWI